MAKAVWACTVSPIICQDVLGIPEVVSHVQLGCCVVCIILQGIQESLRLFKSPLKRFQLSFRMLKSEKET